MQKIWAIQLITLLTWTTSCLYGSVPAQDFCSPPPVEQKMWYVSPALVGFDSTKGWSAWPLLGLGYRWQSQHIGTDTSLWLTGHPEGAIITKLDFLCHYIPCPNHASQWYLGAGVGIGSFWVLAFGALVGVIPEVAVGYQYQTSKGGPRFVQLQAATLVWDSGRGWAADLQGGAHLTLSYGFGF